MARQYKKKHAWEKVRFRQRANYLEAVEDKAGETFVAYLLGAGPWVSLVAYLALANPIEEFPVIMISSFGFMLTLAILILYRPPRVVRVYADEQLVQRSRKLLLWYGFSKWFDLGQGRLTVERIQVQGDVDASGGLTAAGCLLGLFGPLGLLVHMISAASSKRQMLRAYALMQPGVSDRPISIFLRGSAPRKLVAHVQPTDTRSSERL